MKGRKVRTVTVSAKGQVVLPADVRKELGIRTGTELVLVTDGKRLLLEKESQAATRLVDDFADLRRATEESLKGLWDNEADAVWDNA